MIVALISTDSGKILAIYHVSVHNVTINNLKTKLVTFDNHRAECELRGIYQVRPFLRTLIWTKVHHRSIVKLEYTIHG